MKPTSNLLIPLLALITVQTQSTAQTVIGTPIKPFKTFVLDVADSVKSLEVEMEGDPVLASEIYGTVFLDDSTQVFKATGLDVAGLKIGKKKETPLDRKLIRPGVEIEVFGQRIRNKIIAQKVYLHTDVEDWKMKISGVFEKLEGNVATIDGQKVVFPQGQKIEGSGGWKKMEFHSFQEMMLGSFVTVEGQRRDDGILYVQDGKTEPNDYTQTEQMLKATISQNLGFLEDSTQTTAGLQRMQNMFPSLSPNHLSNNEVVIGGQRFPLVKDFKVQAYVNKVGFKLIPAYMHQVPEDDPAHINFRFYVIDNPTFNAFAYPEGSIFVHTGLLEVLENEAQLAAILGHEIAHVTQEHGKAKYEANTLTEAGKKAAGAVGKIFTKDKTSSSPFNLEAATDIIGDALTSAYGRDNEDQADRVGLFYMVDAGYDPREAPKVWSKLMNLNLKSGAQKWVNVLEETTQTIDQINLQTEDFENGAKGLMAKGTSVLLSIALKKSAELLYSTHPRSKNRFKNLNRLIATYYYETPFDQSVIGDDTYTEALSSIR